MGHGEGGFDLLQKEGERANSLAFALGSVPTQGCDVRTLRCIPCSENLRMIKSCWKQRGKGLFEWLLSRGV